MRRTAQAEGAFVVLSFVSIDVIDDPRGRLELDRVAISHAMLDDLQFHGQLK
jgi:hypothetical protein